MKKVPSNWICSAPFIFSSIKSDARMAAELPLTLTLALYKWEYGVSTISKSCISFGRSGSNFLLFLHIVLSTCWNDINVLAGCPRQVWLKAWRNFSEEDSTALFSSFRKANSECLYVFSSCTCSCVTLRIF